MKNTLKVLLSACIVFAVLGIFLMGIAIAGSSHNISSEGRNDAMTDAFIALVVGGLVIIAIWLPWKKILGRL